jgi:signal transduction histidine kinase
MEIVLEVSDQGTGISPETLEGSGEAASHAGLGIAGMRERVQEIGGRLEILSSHEGTTINTTLPLGGSGLRTQQD